MNTMTPEAPRRAISEVENIDCMIGMARYPDKYFDLAIVDPPFGIGKFWMKDKKTYKYGKEKRWNEVIPGAEYFKELFRVSKNQIIWGGNYFTDFLPPVNGWLIWDKGVPAEVNFSQVCMAWTSFSISSRIKRVQWSGALCQGRAGFHPCEMPISICKWPLKILAVAGMKILDTHMGSQSSRIAAFNMGFDYVGFELDCDYFEAGNKRFKEQTMQAQMFTDDPDLFFTPE